VIGAVSGLRPRNIGASERSVIAINGSSSGTLRAICHRRLSSLEMPS
jgi:hypothetical protein